MPEAREQEVTPQPEGPVVLVAENDDKACELLTILLTRQGYRVVTARDGEEAVAKARELLPWALLLDIDLPRKDGWDVLQELKRSELTREIPVVIVSVVDDVARGFSLGAYDYFIKPVRPEALFRSLRRCRGVHRDPPGYGSSVLIIDDDAHQREALAQILKQEGYRVSKALSGEEGIARIVRESPDLVLVDLMMPGTSGFEVIERIRDLPKAREIPFAVLAEGQASAQEKAHLNGQLRKVYQTVDGFQEKLLQDLRKLQAHFPPRGHLIDTETGLYNQKYFLRRVVEEVRRVQRYRRPFSLLVMTVDIPSDRGSMTLQEIGRLLKANLRDTDIVAHWSGTTFTMILPEAMQEEATKVGEKLKNIIEGQGSARGFSVSFEVCVCDGADGKLRALMSRLHALLEETPMVKAPVGAPA